MAGIKTAVSVTGPLAALLPGINTLDIVEEDYFGGGSTGH